MIHTREKGVSALFQLRSLGTVGRALIGVQVPESKMISFHRFLKSMAYPYQAEGNNIAYRMFVGPPVAGF